MIQEEKAHLLDKWNKTWALLEANNLEGVDVSKAVLHTFLYDVARETVDYCSSGGGVR